MASPHPPARRLSQRRGSMCAPDPFLQHEPPKAASGSSRITIVRVPTVKDSTPPSPGTRPSDLARRSSWGSNKSGGSDNSAGHGRGRMSFAFATFTPISAAPGPALPDRSGTPTSSGPPSPSSSRHKGRTYSNPSSTHPAVPRVAQLTPQQLYEVAQQAINPAQANSTSPKYGYGGEPIPAAAVAQGAGTVQAAPFVPLPSEVYLPFINRPQEVQHLLSTPQTGRLFALLASTFPQEHAPSRPSSAMSHRTAGGAPAYHFSDLPEDPKVWTFTQLSFWLRHVTRQEANDRDWIHKIRTCINSRSEVLWQRFAGALGVPPGFEEEEEESAVADEDDFELGDERPVGVGRTAHESLRGRVGASAESEKGGDPSSLPEEDSMFVNVDDLEEEYDPSSLPGSDAIIEPITASSGPPPPSMVSPTEGLGLSPGETTHALGDVTEEDEEEESASKPSTSLPSKFGSHLAAGQKGYVPRAHSPLAESTSAEAPKDRPALNLTEATLPTEPEEHTGGSSEIDFSEPDPNAEPIQGIRIMNAPMSLFPGSSRFTDSEMISSPAQYTPPHTAGGGDEAGRPRSGSNASFRVGGVPNRFTAHQRTQSFGAFGIQARKRSGSNASVATLDRGPSSGGAGSPHFPGSFAGLGGGPALGHPSFLRNPRGPTPGRPAGISLGAGMHYTPRGPGGRFKLGGLATSGSAVSLSEG